MSRFSPPRGTKKVKDGAMLRSPNPPHEMTRSGDKTPSARLRLVEDPPAELPTFEELYRAHASYVATIAYRLLGRPDDVDDVVHDTFLQARRSLDKVRDPAAIRGWLATITVRVTRRSIKRGRWRRLVSLGRQAPDEVAPANLSRTDHAYLEAAYARLATLPTDERIAWILRRVHNAQLGAVAAMVGCSLATVKRRIAAADEKLKEVQS